MNVAQIRGQDWQEPLGIIPFAISAQQGLDRKTVAKVVQTWTSARTFSSQANLAGEYVERPVDFTHVQTVAILVQKKKPSRSSAETAVSAFEIGG